MEQLICFLAEIGQCELKFCELPMEEREAGADEPKVVGDCLYLSISLTQLEHNGSD